MQARTFWKTVTLDNSNLLGQLIRILNENEIRFCVVGGQAVNAYVEPVVSLDLDLAVATEQLSMVASLLSQHFACKRFPHSLNVTLPDSDLRVQIQLDPRYGEFVERSELREILTIPLPVACLEDVLRGKVWAAQDPDRRASKRQKDLADIARLLEAFPEVKDQLPSEILARLV